MKTSELVGSALDWAVAKAQGRALRRPRRGTDEEANLKQVPFQMLEVVQITQPDGTATAKILPITVTRFGVLPDCQLPSINFTDAHGIKSLGAVDLFYFDPGEAALEAQEVEVGGLDDFSPSTDWSQGGPIIDRELNNLFKHNQLDKSLPPVWCAVINVPGEHGTKLLTADGPTPLIAAMRCYVAFKLGEEVDVPEELL